MMCFQSSGRNSLTLTGDIDQDGYLDYVTAGRKFILGSQILNPPYEVLSDDYAGYSSDQYSAFCDLDGDGLREDNSTNANNQGNVVYDMLVYDESGGH